MRTAPGRPDGAGSGACPAAVAEPPRQKVLLGRGEGTVCRGPIRNATLAGEPGINGWTIISPSPRPSYATSVGRGQSIQTTSRSDPAPNRGLTTHGGAPGTANESVAGGVSAASERRRAQGAAPAPACPPSTPPPPATGRAASCPPRRPSGTASPACRRTPGRSPARSPARAAAARNAAGSSSVTHVTVTSDQSARVGSSRSAASSSVRTSTLGTRRKSSTAAASMAQPSGQSDAARGESPRAAAQRHS